MKRAIQTEHPYAPLRVTQGDLLLATAAFAWTVGFSTWAVATAYRQTRRYTTYILLCWLEILVCAIFAIICWLYLYGTIKHSFTFFFSILTCWALQVQFLLQIIVNRICVLLPHPRQRRNLKAVVAVLITAVNISVYCIWVPAKLQVSDRYHWINLWWDRVEKVIYLLVDGVLNYMFIRVVKDRLLSLGLTKYDPLVSFNVKIVWLSLAMDVLIITMMSHPNDFVYMQFHPVAYMVKLQIEMTMSNLIVKIVNATNEHMTLPGSGGRDKHPEPIAFKRNSNAHGQNTAPSPRRGSMVVTSINRGPMQIPRSSLSSIELGELGETSEDQSYSCSLKGIDSSQTLGECVELPSNTREIESREVRTQTPPPLTRHQDHKSEV